MKEHLCRYPGLSLRVEFKNGPRWVTVQRRREANAHIAMLLNAASSAGLPRGTIPAY